MTWHCKTYSELSKEELYSLLKFRVAVFVVEQDCPYQDLDDKDQEGLHLFATEGNNITAYARLLPVGSSYPSYCSIGRVLVQKSLRGSPLATQLMHKSIAACQQHYGGAIKISAQEHLEAFYTRFGFTRESKSYLEDGIPHIAMLLAVK